MFCGKCGTQLPEGANCCPNCGEKVEKELDFSAVTNYAGQKAKKVVSNVAQMQKDYKEQNRQLKEDRKLENIEDMFVSSNEQMIDTLGSSYLQNFLHNGLLGKGFGVLTDKRLYFHGKCYRKAGGHYIKSDEEYIFDLQDIVSSGFQYVNRFFLPILSIIALIIGILVVIVGTESGYGEFMAIGICIILVALILFIAYFLSKNVWYEISSAGASIRLNVSHFGRLKEVKQFDKKVRQAKDHLLS